VSSAGFDFHSLYKKLEETHGALQQHFGTQDQDLRVFYERMGQETDHLKSVLAVKSHMKLQNAGEGHEEGQ